MAGVAYKARHPVWGAVCVAGKRTYLLYQLAVVSQKGKTGQLGGK